MPGPQPVSSRVQSPDRGAEGEGDQNRQASRTTPAAVVTMLWIDRVRSRAYQTPKTTAKGRREDAGAQCEGNVPDVGEDVGVQGARDADHDDGQPVGERHVAVEAQLPAPVPRPSTTVKISAVALRPTPSVMLIQSAKLSPTVVHRILMIQNHTVTSGTLLSMVRWRRAIAGLAVLVTRPERRGTPLNRR